jgi:hypothetical protein
MSIGGITNLNQYAAAMAKTTNISAKPVKAKDKLAATEGNSRTDKFMPSNAPMSEEELAQRRADRDAMRGVSIEEARQSMEDSHPMAASVAASKERAEKGRPIYNKAMSGQPLTEAEKSFLREHYPEVYAQAIRIEQEVNMLKSQMSSCKTKEDAQNLLMQRKAALLSGGKNDPSAMLLVSALDGAFRNL